VTPGKKVVFDYATNTRPGSMAMPLPTRAVMLKTGNILIRGRASQPGWAPP